MTPNAITTEAVLQPDGKTLQLKTCLSLPPGPVIVTVQPVSPATGSTMLDVLDRIHREQRQRGRKVMTEEEMDAEIKQMRADDDEYDKRCQEIWSQTETPNHLSGRP